MSCKIINAPDSGSVQSFDWGLQPQSASARRPARSLQFGSPGEDVEQQIEQARKQGFQDGIRHAESAVQQQFQSQLNEIGARLSASLADLAALRPRLRHQSEAQVVELAMLVARKILHRTLSMDPDALSGLVKAALGRIDARELLEIRVAPVHHAPVKSALDRLGLPSQVQLIADASLEPGAVLIESDRGRLDASVSTQLAEIERGFADFLTTGGTP
jgi:flagellar assembly protein FliH